MNVIDAIKESVSIGKLADLYDLKDLGECPSGHESKGGKCFGINHRDNFFHCFNCGIGGDIIDLVMLIEKVNFQIALKWLCEKYRPDLLPMVGSVKEPSPEEKEKIATGSLFDQIYQYGKDLLHGPKGRASLEYLTKERGYDPEALKKTEWIFWPPEKEIRKHLQDLHPEASQDLKDRIKNIPLNGHEGDGFSRLAIPYRDRSGIITGFLKRSTDPKADKRWDSTPGTTKADLFGLHRCKGQKDLLIVEGYPDALYFPAIGLADVVAIGQGVFSRGYLAGLEASGVRTVTIAFDNDGVGPGNTEKAIEVLQEAGIKVFVLDPPLMSPHKDPDEYVKGNGLEAFKEILKKAEHGSSWKVKRIIRKHDLQTDKGQNDALEEAIEYIGTLTDGASMRACQGIIRTILEIPEDELADRIQDYADRKREHAARKGYEDLSRTVSGMVSAGKPISEIQEYTSSKTLELRGKSGERGIEPYRYDDLKEDIRTSPAGLKTGYPSLDNYLVIQPGTVNIIAGRPSHGKTTFMMNVFINMIEEYKDKAFFFFSYEERRKRLAVKMISILSEAIIHRHKSNKNIVLIENYIKGGNTGNGELNGGISKYRDYTDHHRLFVIDNPYTIGDLANTITALNQRHDIGAIFVDYIQKVKLPEKAPTRQVELQRISAIFLETAVNLNIPIILGAQVNREVSSKDELTEDKLREAGDLEQDANIVLGIWNEGKASKEQTDQETVDFIVKGLKNRDGRPSFETPLKFHQPVLKIREA